MILGRRVPVPVDEKRRLTPAFVEWMMGFDDGWTEGHPRTVRLRMLGNAVVPQQAEVALRAIIGTPETPAAHPR